MSEHLLPAVEKRKEKEDVQRKSVEDVVDYINLSLINIMEFKDKYTITLPKNKLAYYKKHQNNDVFKSIHVGFELEGDQLKQVSGGNPLVKYNKEDIDKVIGKGGYLERLHNAGIYHGDIITGVFNKEEEEYDDLKINVGNILKDDEGKIKLIDFGPIDENEKRSHDELMRIEKEMLKQVREEGVTETYSPERIRNTDLTSSEKKRRREKDKENDGEVMDGYKSDDSTDSIPSPPKVPRRNNVKNVKDPTVRSLMFGGKKKRRRTKKKRRRKRKYTRRKKKRKRRRTKKKRRKRR